MASMFMCALLDGQDSHPGGSSVPVPHTVTSSAFDVHFKAHNFYVVHYKNVS